MAAVHLDLLADRPDLGEPVGLLRCSEWGKAPEPEDPAWWVDATEREAGRGALPVTYVAVAGDIGLVGAAGIGRLRLKGDASQSSAAAVARSLASTTGLVNIGQWPESMSTK